VGAVLSSLSDAQIDLLQEMSSLREAGFDPDTVAVFMADRHAKAMQAVEAFQERYATIQEQMKPKTRPKQHGQNGRGRQSVRSLMQV
jgi:DNA-binding transcriptional MerR regulator